MNRPAISLKPIHALLGESFFVPAYQRGYRWTKQQVDELLDDIWDFQCGEATKERFYCLQPVVVKKREDGAWELVDGQQRLTTVFLILTYLRLLLEEGIGKSRFNLTFETRSKTCGAFLANIDPSRREENIDYYHICDAYQAIEQWFGKKDGSARIKLLQCLTNDDVVGKNVKVIWYELPDSEDPVEAFTRLNVGKIPLTNAELIRALFLQSGNFTAGTVSLHQLKIAQEWDGIEKTLQRDDVWYFLHFGQNSPPNRIEYLFQLIAHEETDKDPSQEDAFYTFRFYNGRFNAQNRKADTEWFEVKKYFMTLEEWFEDRTLYHLIGFLIHDGDGLLELRKLGAGVAKSAFERSLKHRIFHRLTGKELGKKGSREALRDFLKRALSELEYGSDSRRIRSFLLLFNIATLLQNDASNLRFPFDHYEKDDWDIEHVRSVESGRPNKPGEQERWLRNAAECLDKSAKEKELRSRLEAVLAANKFESAQFDPLYEELLHHFGEDTVRDTDNSIANLALLDAATNRSYKNAPFPVKRRVILQRDREGVFVPLCTKNVFIKCYSDRIGNMMLWTEDDSRAYLAAIVGTLVDFFFSAEGRAA